MNSTSYYNQANKKDAVIIDLEKKVSASEKIIADSEHKINTLKQQIIKTKSLYSIKSKESSISSEQKKIERERTKIVRYRKDIVTRMTEKSKLLQKGDKESIRETTATIDKIKKNQKSIEKKVDYQAAQIEEILGLMKSRSEELAPLRTTEYDFFISLASEDSEDIATPLYEGLSKKCKVWYDKNELTIGTNQRKAIDDGLRSSKYGIVILSPSYLSKYWTQYELDSLFVKESATISDIILPIWHHVGIDDIRRYSYNLANKTAFKDQEMSIEDMVDNLLKLIQ